MSNPQTLNLYSYVRNNPLKYVDPFGHQDELHKKKGKKGDDATDPIIDPSSVKNPGISVKIILLGPVSELHERSSSSSNALSMIMGMFFSRPVTIMSAHLPPGSWAAKHQLVPDPYAAVGGGIFEEGAEAAGGIIMKVFGWLFTKEVAEETGVHLTETLLKPGGILIGKAGTNASIREVNGGVEAAETLFSNLTKGGEVMTNPNYPGTLIKMQDGQVFGLRTIMSRSPGTAATIDVNSHLVPEISKIKFNPGGP